MTATAYATETAVRNNPDLIGREAYEAAIAARPNYPDGSARKTWDQLGSAERWSWSRPTQRP